MPNERQMPKFRGFHESKDGKQTINLDGKQIKGFWVYGHLFQNNIIIPPAQIVGYKHIRNKDYNTLTINNNVKFYFVIPETVGECTDMTDTNDKEIYEGDIVKLFNTKGTITKERSAFGIGTLKQIDYDTLEQNIPFNNSPAFCYNDNFISLWEIEWNLEAVSNDSLDTVEIIGNVYENHDLIWG